MASYVYVQNIGKYIPQNDKRLEKIEKVEDLAANGNMMKQKEVSASALKKENISKLPNGGNNLMPGQQIKGGQFQVGGFNAIQGLGEIGKKDPYALFSNEPEIPATGLGYDVLGKMEDLGKHMYIKKIKDNKFINDITECNKGGGYTPDKLDYGFTKKSIVGYKTKDHGPKYDGDTKVGDCGVANNTSKTGVPTTGLQLPVKMKTGEKENLHIKLDAYKIAKAGAKAMWGYEKQYDIDEYGYMPDNMDYAARLLTCSKGAKNYPSKPGTLLSYGNIWQEGGGYTGSGIGTESTPIATRVDGPDGSGNPISKTGKGFRTPINFNSSFPIVKGKLAPPSGQ